MINAAYVARLMAEDWGFYHTSTTNLTKVQAAVDAVSALDDVQRSRIREQAAVPLKYIEDAPKSKGWQNRAKSRHGEAMVQGSRGLDVGRTGRPMNTEAVLNSHREDSAMSGARPTAPETGERPAARAEYQEALAYSGEWLDMIHQTDFPGEEQAKWIIEESKSNFAEHFNRTDSVLPPK